MAKTRSWTLTLTVAALSLGAASAGPQDIFDAVKGNDLARVKAVLEKDPSLARAKDGSGSTPLHIAARQNRTAIAELLIATGADLEARDEGGYTPLSNITRTAGNFEALELLVRKGANFNARDSLGNTPLDNAVLYANEDNRTIELFLDRGAETNTAPDSEIREILSNAALRGHARLFEYYRARGGEALFADASNRRAFMRSAIVGGSIEIVKKLQARGIPLDVSADWRGATPLHGLASNRAGLAMIELLVRNGANVKARTNDGRSAYNIADRSGNREAASLLLELGASPEPQQFPRLIGPYLGQTPPESESRFFAPGIVDVYHGTISVSPDGQEIYWPALDGRRDASGRSGTVIMTTRIRDGRWTQPAYAPFSGQGNVSFKDDVPFVTPDNKRLFFTSQRPIGADTSQKENIWFVERTATGWSEPKPVGEAVNGMALHWQVSVSRSGALYFAGRNDNDTIGGPDVYCSRLVDGQYTKPVNLGPAINSKQPESQPFIAPDESFIIFYRVFNQVPSAYASFKGRNGQWLPAVKFDLAWGAGGGLIVSPDGKYLFYGSDWKSARFLDDLRRQAEAAAKGQEDGHGR